MVEKKPIGQRQRFVDMARELGCDEDPKAFEKAFAKVVPSKPRPLPSVQPKGRTK